MTIMIRVSKWHNEVTKYGICTHKTSEEVIMGRLKEIAEKLRQIADNVDAVKLDNSVSSISINTDDRHIMQIAGWSYRRGMYCDVY